MQKVVLLQLLCVSICFILFENWEYLNEKINICQWNYMYNFHLLLALDNISTSFKYAASSFVRLAISSWYMWINISWSKIGFISLKRRSFNIPTEGFHSPKKTHIAWTLHSQFVVHFLWIFTSKHSKQLFSNILPSLYGILATFESKYCKVVFSPKVNSIRSVMYDISCIVFV